MTLGSLPRIWMNPCLLVNMATLDTLSLSLSMYMHLDIQYHIKELFLWLKKICIATMLIIIIMLMTAIIINVNFLISWGVFWHLCGGKNCITLGLTGDSQVLYCKRVSGLKLLVNYTLFLGIKALMLSLQIQNESTWNACYTLFIVTKAY